MDMNFKEFFLLNELFGDFNYVLPEDKEQQLYDFYMLSFLKGQANRFNYGQIRKPYDDEMDQEDKLDFMLKEVEKTLIPELKQNLLDAVFYSLAAEIRHIFDSVRESPDSILHLVKEKMNNNYAEILKKYVRKYVVHKNQPTFYRFSDKANQTLDQMGEREIRNKGYQASFDSLIKTEANKEDIVKLMQFLYLNLNWNYSYGGEKWAQIANGWLKLNAAKTEAENIIYIDHVYDLQHNTDTVFNKLSSYEKKGSHSWIQNALNFKRDIKEPHEIIDLVSPRMKRLALRVIKMKFGKTYEDFMKEKEKSNPPAKVSKVPIVHNGAKTKIIKMDLELPANDKGELLNPLDIVSLEQKIEAEVAKLGYSLSSLEWVRTIKELGLYTMKAYIYGTAPYGNYAKESVEIKLWILPKDNSEEIAKLFNVYPWNWIMVARNFLNFNLKPDSEPVLEYIQKNINKFPVYYSTVEFSNKLKSYYDLEIKLISHFEKMNIPGNIHNLNKVQAEEIYKKLKCTEPLCEDHILSKIKEELRNNKKISAIKIFREHSKWSLLASKKYIEYLLISMIVYNEFKSNGQTKTEIEQLFTYDKKDVNLEERLLTIARNFLRTDIPITSELVVQYVNKITYNLGKGVSSSSDPWFYIHKIEDLIYTEKSKMDYFKKLNVISPNSIEFNYEKEKQNFIKIQQQVSASNSMPYIRPDVLNEMFTACQNYKNTGIIPIIKIFRLYSNWYLFESKKFIEYFVCKLIFEGKLPFPKI